MALSLTARAVFCYALDVADSAAVAVLGTGGKARFDRTTIGVTNSGSPPSNLEKSTSPKVWQATADPLLISNHLFAGETLPGMQMNKGRRLITIISFTDKQPVDGSLLWGLS